MVKTGQVTYAVRDTRLDDKEIHEGDIMGIGDKGILAVGKGKENVAKEMVAAMVDEDSEVISIYYGAETHRRRCAGSWRRTGSIISGLRNRGKFRRTANLLLHYFCRISLIMTVWGGSDSALS